MAIDTQLDLSSFNVIKYIFVFVIFDVVIRLSLRGIAVFFRRNSLYHGHSVPLQNEPFDRYNIREYSQEYRSLTSLFLFLVTLSAYAVEFLLEFSTDSIERTVAIPGNVRVMNASLEVCSFGDAITSNSYYDMIQIADECIDIDPRGRMYVFYKYVWHMKTSTDSSTSSSKELLCVRSEDNILSNNSLIYSTADIQFREEKEIDDLKAASFGANGDPDQDFIVIQVRSNDIFVSREYMQSGKLITAGYITVQLPSRSGNSIKCYGYVFGRHGANQMLAEISFCIYSQAFIYVDGSVLIKEDASVLNQSNWKVEVACMHGRVIRNFAKGLKSGFLNTDAFAKFLGSVKRPDERSIQKYAALYHNCENVRVPLQYNAEEKTIPNAMVQTTVTVSVKTWSLVLLCAWSALLAFISILLTSIAKRKKMPDNIFGEQAMARRWMKCSNEIPRKQTFSERCDESDFAQSGTSRIEDSSISAELESSQKPSFLSRLPSIFRKNKPMYLSVVVGHSQDDIAISLSKKYVKRNKQKTFQDVLTENDLH